MNLGIKSTSASMSGTSYSYVRVFGRTDPRFRDAVVCTGILVSQENQNLV